MISLPSFLTNFSFSLPSLPSISLPDNIQRRFLSYVLKRTLGRFVAHQALDAERIQAQISEGRVELESLEADCLASALSDMRPILIATQEINQYLPPSLPLILTSGTLYKLTARLPFPNLWSGPLDASLETLVLNFSLSKSSPLSQGKATSRLRGRYDLTESVNSAADDFLHQELNPLEEEELEGSIRQSLTLSSQANPFFSKIPGEFPTSSSLGSTSPSQFPLDNVESTTVLAGMVERILARLELKVGNAKIRIKVEDEGIVELRVGSIVYANESELEDSGNQTVLSRAIRINSIELAVLPLQPIPAPCFRKYRTSSYSSSKSADSSASSSSGQYNDMKMSRAIADLRQSVAEIEKEDESLYESTMFHSAISHPAVDNPFEESAGEAEEESSRSATPTPKGKVTSPQGLPVLSFGQENIVIQMRTTRPLPHSTNQLSSLGPILPNVEIKATMGTLAIVLLPNHLKLFATVMTSLSATKQEHQPVENPSKQTVRTQLQLQTTTHLKSFHFITVYDLSCTQSSEVHYHLETFFSRPTSSMPFGHLRIKAEDLRATYVVQTNSNKPRLTSRPTATALDHGVQCQSSSQTGYSSQCPFLTLKISDASITEHLISHNEGKTLPVVIFDQGLTKQYDSYSSTNKASHSFPQFEANDWRTPRRSSSGEKSWKVKLRGKGILKSNPSGGAHEEEVISVIQKAIGNNAATIFTLQPIHFFLDLSFIERLLPFLSTLTPFVQPSNPVGPSSPHTTLATHGQITPEHIISSLPIPTARTRKAPLELWCSVARLSMRCPEAPKGIEKEAWSDGSRLRSGVISFDVHGFHARVMKGSPSLNVQGSPMEQAFKIDFTEALIFFAPSGQRYAYSFFVLSSLLSDPNEDAVPILPSLVLLSASPPLAVTSAPKTNLIQIKIPLVRSSLHQFIVIGLHYLADDLTRWLDGAITNSNAKPRDELKMIGSRFFGESRSSEASSEVDEEIEIGEIVGIGVQVGVDEVEVKLNVPKLDSNEEERTLFIKASDVKLELENRPISNKTALSLTVMDLRFTDISAPASLTILERTTPFTLTSHQKPVLGLYFSSSTNPLTAIKESNISVSFSHTTFAIHKDVKWIHELAEFAKPPPGVFENLSPTDLTSLAINISASSFLLVPPNLSGSIIITLREGKARAEIRKGAVERVLKLVANGIGALAIEEEGGKLEIATDLVETWKRAGYVHLADMSILELQLLRDLISGEISLDVIQAQFKLTACADSLTTFGQLATDFGSLFPNKKIKRLKSPTLIESINVFGSLDESAFDRLPEIVSQADADMVEDDLPHNLDYLDRTTRLPQHYPPLDSSTKETLRTWQTPGENNDEQEWGVGEGGETIRIFREAEEEQGYWDNLPILNNNYVIDQNSNKTRIHVQNASLKILLYEGYDWPRTRQAIENEVRAVRRRLERIRQLLASGQKADESIERATSSVLFNSVYIGLEHKGDISFSEMGLGKVDEKVLMAAIDEELDGFETESGSSWQTLPAGVGAGTTATHQPLKKTRLKGKRLTRSKKPQIEINVSGIKADIDVYQPEDPTALRIHVLAKELDILDHIKTSTWKKFLTEMKADSRGNIRETDADMVRVELVGVRLEEDEEELRLRVKILPLRLHVDQDALDFLKRFFSFKAPSSPSESQNYSSPPGPYFQHVEIFPIQLKLDYKPKRVDFQALREGKTIELMNFFHFDGAEMTLRHITLSGITGFERLGNTLQDLWTPDVKANQLADVISGVSPIRSMVNVGSGVADLILLPIEQYRKDGRVSKGIQRGANSFVKSTALEMMKVGARLATGTQVILEKAESILGGKLGENMVGQVRGSASERLFAESGLIEEGSSSDDEEELVSRYANQPNDMKEGVQAAYKSLSTNVNAAAQTILAVPMEVYERPRNNGPLKAVIRAVPIAVLKPMIGTSEAVSKTLLGMRNSLDPSARLELGDKYK
nr:hypothetical protein L204_03549 [Cryptococcus depauperatus CBS 7855]